MMVHVSIGTRYDVVAVAFQSQLHRADAVYYSAVRWGGGKVGLRALTRNSPDTNPRLP